MTIRNKFVLVRLLFCFTFVMSFLAFWFIEGDWINYLILNPKCTVIDNATIVERKANYSANQRSAHIEVQVEYQYKGKCCNDKLVGAAFEYVGKTIKIATVDGNCAFRTTPIIPAFSSWILVVYFIWIINVVAFIYYLKYRKAYILERKSIYAEWMEEENV